jgi:hypothetical protein
MSKNLAAILAAPASLETHVISDVCLDQRLRSELQRLVAERVGLPTPKVAEESGERTGPPRKAGQRAESPRLAEINAEIQAVREKMRDSSGDLVVGAPEDADWQAFKDAHPPREGNRTDEEIALGMCDATALLADLPKYVVSWGGEEIAVKHRDAFVKRMAYSDQVAAASAVVAMYETRVSVPKSLSGSSETEGSATV